MSGGALPLLREFVEQGCIATDGENQVNQCFWCWQVQPWNDCPKEGVAHDADCLYARAKAFTDGVDGGGDAQA